MHWLRFRFNSLKQALVFVLVFASISAFILYMLVFKGNLTPQHDAELDIRSVIIVAVFTAVLLGSFYTFCLIGVDLLVPARGFFFKGFLRVIGIWLVSVVFFFVSLLAVTFEYITAHVVLYVIFLTFLVFVYNRINAFRKSSKGIKNQRFEARSE